MLRETTAGVPDGNLHPIARLSWRAILAGAVASIAITWLFFTLAGAIGLTAMEPTNGVWMSPAGGVAMGFLALVAAAAGSFLGGLISVRASSITDRTDALIQGLTTWALAFLFSAVVSSFFGVLTSTGAMVAAADVVDRAEVARADGARGGEGAAVRRGGENRRDFDRRDAAGGREGREGRGGGFADDEGRAAAGGAAGGAAMDRDEAARAQRAADTGAGLSWAVFASGIAGALAGMAGGLVGVDGLRFPRRRRPDAHPGTPPHRPVEPAPLAP